MRIAAVAVALALLSAASGGRAGGIACNPDGTQAEMNLCARQDFERADARLNAAYRKALSALDGANAELLRKAQRAWLAYRDAECVYEAAPNQGGSIYPLTYNGCLTALTEARTKRIAQGRE